MLWWSSRKRDKNKDEVKEGERIVRTESIVKNPRGIENLKEPYILLRSWVEIQGKNVRLEYWSKAIQALKNELQHLELPHGPLPAEAENVEESFMAKKDAHNLLTMKFKRIKKEYKYLKDLLDKFREAERHERIGQNPAGIENLKEPHILLRSWVEIQGKTVRLEHWSKGIKALQNELQDLKPPHKGLIVEEIREQGGKKNDRKILRKQKL